MRRNLVLFVALAVLIAVDLATVPRLATRASGGPLFADLERDRAARIEVRAADGETLSIERTSEGPWRVPAAADFPADPWLVEELLGSLAQVARADLVAEDPSEPADFGLAEGRGVEVRVLDRAGTLLAGYRQGEQLARAGGIEGVYLSAEGRPAVYRAPLVPRLAVDLESWLRTRVADPDLALLRGLTLEVAGVRTLPFERTEAGRWSAPGEGEPPEVALDRLATACTELFLSGVADTAPQPEHGFDPPRLVVELTLDDPEDDRAPRVRRLSIGADLDGVTFVTWDGWPEPWVVEVRTALLERLLESVVPVFAAATLEDE